MKAFAEGAAGRAIAVADYLQKLGVVAFDQVSPIQKINVLVTDPGADPGLLEQIAGAGVDVPTGVTETGVPVVTRSPNTGRAEAGSPQPC